MCSWLLWGQVLYTGIACLSSNITHFDLFSACRILDLIDSYERQIYVLKHELELSKLGESLPSSNIPTGSCVDSQAGESQVDGPTTSSQTLTATDEKLEATPNYKALIKVGKFSFIVLGYSAHCDRAPSSVVQSV